MSLPKSSSDITPEREAIVRDFLRLSRRQLDDLLVRRLEVEQRRDNVVVVAADYGFTFEEIAKSLGMQVGDVAQIVADWQS